MPRLVLSLLLAVLACLSVRADEVVFPPPPLPPGVPFDAFPSTRIDQLQQFSEHLAQARAMPQVDLILDGGAISEGWLHNEHGGEIYRKDYVPRHVADFALLGDKTQNVLWRVAHGELDGLHPKLIMLEVGWFNLGENPPKEIADGITKIVQAYRARCPDAHILLLGVFPRGEKANDASRAKIKAVNAIISKLDDGAHVTYLDIADKLLQPDGTLSPDMLAGSLPSPKGYRAWADAVQPVIDKYCPVPTPAGTLPPAPSPAELAKIEATLPQVTWPLPADASANQTTATAEAPRIDWYLRFTANLARPKTEPYDFILDGDSITDRWQSPGAGLPVWQDKWAKYKVLDNAIGGDQVPHVLWRVQHGDLDGLDPKLIMLLIGTNDHLAPPKDIAQGIRAILDEYEKRCPHTHVLLLGLFPRDETPDSKWRTWVKAVNAVISGFASDPRVTYLDIGDKFLQPDGTISKDMMPDFLHPTTKGYGIWADAVQPVLEKYLGPAK